MSYSFLSGAKAPTKILFTILVMFVSYLIFSLLSFLLAMQLFHLNFDEISNAMSNYTNQGNMMVIKYFQLVQSISLFIIPSILVAVIIGGHWPDFLHLRMKPAFTSIILVLLIVIVSVPFINYLAEINNRISFPGCLASAENWLKEMEEKMEKITSAFLAANTVGEGAYNLLLIAVVPALGEELIFRGLFQKFFAQWFKNIHAGIIVSAFLFSVLHFQFYGIIPRMLLGVLFGYFLIWGKSLWLPIIAHFINNAVAVFYYSFSEENYGQGSLDKFGSTEGAYIYVIISGVLFAAIAFAIYKIESGKIKLSPPCFRKN